MGLEVVKYRPHRGQLADAMAEVAEVSDFHDLVRHMRAECPDWIPDWAMPTEANVTLRPYGWDDRIGWDTQIVLVNGKAWGFTSAPFAPAPAGA